MTGDERGSGPDSGTGFSTAFRVRFDEAAPDGLARASALLRYAQECAWVHSEALGFGREWYAARGLTWVVRCVELSVVGRAPTGAPLDVSTRVVGFRRVWARRRTEIGHPADGVVAVVDSDWVMTDQRRGAPTRVPDEFPRAFGVPSGGFEPHRVALPALPASARRAPLEVRPHELDPLAHANHAIYLDWLEEGAVALPEGPAILAAVPRTYRLEYVAPATLGRNLEAQAWRVVEPEAIAYRITGDGAELFRGFVRADA